jgi:hypothetical protein
MLVPPSAVSGVDRWNSVEGLVVFCFVPPNPLRPLLYESYSTCFNRIDLPVFDSKEELKEKLMLAVTMSSTGFDIE